LLTYPLTSAQLRDELVFVVEHLQACGFSTCDVLFGYAWGNEYYDDNHWVSESLTLSFLIAKVAEVESRGIGCLGSDDLYLGFPTFQFLFCHDSDVHLYFSEDAPLVEFFYRRWEDLGYKPAEWRSTKGTRKVRVRGGQANA